MVNEAPGKILIDKEKVEINGQHAYRLFFYDMMDGTILKVISFIEGEDRYLNKPNRVQEEPEDTFVSNVEELQNALQRD